MSADLYGHGAPLVTSFGFGVKHRRAHSYPRVTCAGCGDLITDVTMAGVVWRPDTVVEEGFSPIVVLCKTNHCLARDPRWQHWPWEELDVYLIWLLQNTGGHPAKKLRALIANADSIAEMAW